MITKDEGRDEGISTALRIEEVMHSIKKYKHGAPRAPLGFAQWPNIVQSKFKTSYSQLTLSQSLNVRCTVVYTSVEKRILCRLLSGVGMVSSCRKYDST